MFVLPLSRWMYPLSHAVALAGLIFFQFLIMIGIYFLHFGAETLLSGTFPWQTLGMGLLSELFAFEALMLMVALLAMAFGRVQTFLLGVFIIVGMQGLGFYYRFKSLLGADATELATNPTLVLYRLLPPFGEPIWRAHFGLWTVWLIIFAFLFQWRVSKPTFNQASGE